MSKNQRTRDTKTEIGENLRFVRLALGYTQKQICDRINVEYPTWSMWECGHRLPDPLAMLRIQRSFGVPMGYVYGAEVMGVPYEIMQQIYVLRSGCAT